MKILRVTISKDTGDYGAWLDDFPGVYGAGPTVEAAKKDLLKGLKLFIEYNPVPTWLRQGKYKIEYTIAD
jgi:predicted RNase H-like HicB family nuclease